MSDNADTPSQESGSEIDPVAAFESVLGKSFGEAPADNAQAKSTVQSAPVDAENKTEVLDELSDDELSPDEELKPEEGEDTPKIFKVKVDGKEIEVPEDELLKGYSRQQDYTKKTMELAGQRQQFEQAQQQIANERAQYQTQLNQLAEALGQELSNAQNQNWEELLATDPVEYLKQQHLFQKRHAAYQSAMQARQQAEQQTQQQAAQAEQQRQIHEREQLLANLPAWADDAKAAKEKALIVKSLTAMGRTPEQIAKFDHIDVLVARKAALYDQMVNKAKDATAKVATLPPRMQKPGVSSPSDGRTIDMQALRKSGSVADAASLFEKML